MDYNLLLKIWVYSSVPFMVGNFIGWCMLLMKNSLLGNQTEDQEKIKRILTDLEGQCDTLPTWVVTLLLSQIGLLLSVLDGLLWVTKPYKQIKKLYNVVFWNFKEIK